MISGVWGGGAKHKFLGPLLRGRRIFFFFTDIPIILTTTTIPLHLIWESMVERVLLFESVKKKKYLRTCKIWCHFCHTIRVLLLLCITSTENANRHSLFIHMECMWCLCAQICNKKMSLGFFLKQTVGQSYKTQMEDGSIIVARWQPEKKAFCTTSKWNLALMGISIVISRNFPNCNAVKQGS